MSRPVILGTAGHIDHGKTSLIRTLTGINTDRLKEEQERGITIELGFAHLTLPNGARLGIVDVPGHEKFVRQMVAGASGIDIVALVIAADEGVMLQTREHMDICRLLGVKDGLIILTKVDLVEDDWLELVEGDVREFVAGSFLENAPMVHFSAIDGSGTDEVIAAITDVAANLTRSESGSLFRMPIDRAFTMKGFGTVVTGTALSGKLARGDTVMLYPSGATAKVRGLQVHNRDESEIVAGLRTAVNLQGLEREKVTRGQVLAHEDTLTSSDRIDIWLTYLQSMNKPLKNRTRVRFHHGTAEIMGRLILLDTEALASGQSGAAQIHLEEATTALGGDHFVIRSYSPVRTIAGGIVLHPKPTRHKRFQEELLSGLSDLKSMDPVKSLSRLIKTAGAKGTSFSELTGLIDLPSKKIKEAVSQILSQKRASSYDKDRGRIIGREILDGIAANVLLELKNYHEEFPLRAGLLKEELKTRVPALADTKLLAFVLASLQKEGKVAADKDIVHLPQHRPNLAGEQKEIEAGLLAIYEKAGLAPPYFRDAAASLAGSSKQQKEVLELLVKNNQLIKIKEDLYLHQEPLSAARDMILKHFENSKELTTPEFKEMTGLTRKYLIPLLEYFDGVNLTLRIEDKRVLRKKI